MAKKLHYFDFNGLGEPIRYMLHYAGEKFEDVRYKYKDWPIKSLKESLPFGQMPLYEEGDRKLNQSIAITRYVARRNILVPSDPWEQAVLDAAVYNIYDFWNKLVVYILEEDPTKKQALKKEMMEEEVVYYFSRFEKELQKNNGFLGGKLSWADFILVGIVESSNLFLEEEIEGNYPHIVALLNKIRSLPGVKEYIASREPYTY